MINLITTSTEDLASYRYRIKVIQEAFLLEGIEARVSPHFLMDADVCLYSKHYSFDYPDAIGAKALGKTIVFDVCDDHSEKEKLAGHYERMVRLADIITCNSDAMRERIWHVYRKKAHHIDDPVLGEPIDKKPDLDKWLWFGHPVNLPVLEEYLDLIEGKTLEICTVTDRPVQREGSTKVTMWSEAEQVEAFKRNGVAFIPYGEGKQKYKSANRVIEALNASLVPVVINPIPAVKELMCFCESSVAAVSEESIAKMELGRAFVRKNFSTKRIGKEWLKTLS